MDWQTMFFGDGDNLFLVEIVIRTTIMYLFTLALVRLMGKRGMAQLTAFEFIIIVALGSSVGDPMFYPEVPLIYGFVVITTVVALQRVLALITQSEKVSEVVAGKPFVVIEDGVVVDDALERELITAEELAEMLRIGGVARLDDVAMAVMEDAGKLSILRKQDARDGPGPEIWSVVERR